MSETEPDKKIIEIVYNPREILDYMTGNEGSLVSSDLEQRFGYSSLEARLIIANLQRSSIIRSKPDDYKLTKEEEGTLRLVRVWHLTEFGEKARESLSERVRLIYSHMPGLSRLAQEVGNDVLQVAGVFNWSPEQVKEMLHSQDPNLMSLLEKRRLAVLGQSSAEELRQLAEDLRNLK